MTGTKVIKRQLLLLFYYNLSCYAKVNEWKLHWECSQNSQVRCFGEFESLPDFIYFAIYFLVLFESVLVGGKLWKESFLWESDMVSKTFF